MGIFLYNCRMNINLNDSAANNQQNEKELRQFVFIAYILQAVFFLFVVTPIFALIINYIKKDDLINSRYHTHYRWQQNTFWFGLLWLILGIMTHIFFVGYVVIFFLTFWYIYRIAKGWIYLSDGKELYQS